VLEAKLLQLQQLKETADTEHTMALHALSEEVARIQAERALQESQLLQTKALLHDKDELIATKTDQLERLQQNMHVLQQDLQRETGSNTSLQTKVEMLEERCVCVVVFVYVPLYVCMCRCMCVCVVMLGLVSFSRSRECVRVCACACMRTYVRVCVRACVRSSVCPSVRVCVRACE